ALVDEVDGGRLQTHEGPLPVAAHSPSVRHSWLHPPLSHSAPSSVISRLSLMPGLHATSGTVLRRGWYDTITPGCSTASPVPPHGCSAANQGRSITSIPWPWKSKCLVGSASCQPSASRVCSNEPASSASVKPGLAASRTRW